ncbi:ABC transporter ATP-binding protein [Aliiroseovarius sp. YM-037]|uniref:ABC transporter ATP-binding protein n=1 Tax=Aliiroseovarius sp. YM-037 TaxID=3341728 RepID=UPI003A8110A3
MTDAKPNEKVFEVDDIHITFDTPDGDVQAVRGVSMHVKAGETVAVVGESGSGKSQVMMAAMGLLASNGHATGSVKYRGQEILNLPPNKINKLRGAKITMIFQEPMTSLDPLFTIEDQLSEPLRVHGGMSRKKASARVLELLKLVQIPNPEKRLKAYPHEMSGGQRQRVMIAMALANDPDLLIADEPTTALDVTIQAEILQLLAELQTRLGMSILFITHDLGIVEAFADRVYVMAKGQVEEEGPTERVFNAPETDYTKMLLAAEPEGSKPPVSSDAPILLEGENVEVTFGHPAGFLRKDTQLRAVDGISIALRKGQTIGVVGESGSGKSTLGRALLQMLPNEGRVVYMGKEISGLDRAGMRPFRDGLQMVFQDPYGSLSPRMTVGEIITEGLLVHEPGLGSKERARRAAEALSDVGLDPAVRNRFPHEFSGGQRQRIAIARAVILRPRIIVLDEPTSALDRSVQKQVIELLRKLQIEHELSYIFISHDLAVVRALSDYVMVMKNGAVVEEGITDQLFDNPSTEYTRELMRAAFDLRALLKRAAEEAAKKAAQATG